MFVCVQLSEPVEGQVQQCLLWAEQVALLPPLSLEQGGLLSIAILTLFAASWGFGAVIHYLLHAKE